VKISLFAQQRISLIFFCCKKGLGITQKVAFVHTNAMPVLSDKHMKNLDESFIEVFIILMRSTLSGAFLGKK